MKITLVSYFYKPVNNVASQRWTALSEYLEKTGHELSVLSGPWSENTDKVSYLADPFSSDGQALKGEAVKTKSASSGLIPSFLLIDGKFLWAFNVVKKLIRSRKMKNHLVIVTGSPWSGVVATSLICHFLKIKYAVDFRDMWANEPLLRLNTPLARKYFAWLEKFCVRHATLIFTVNETIRKCLSEYNPILPSLAITNGFSGQLTWNHEQFNETFNRKNQILYAGSVSNYHGVEHFFAHAKTETPLVFMGRDFVGALTDRKVTHLPEQVLTVADEAMRESAVLLMTLDTAATHYTTGKIISYIKAGRPILFFGPKNSPAAQIILNNRIGWVIDTSEPSRLNVVLAEIQAHLKSKTPFQFDPNIGELKNYSIEKCGAQMHALLQKLTATH